MKFLLKIGLILIFIANFGLVSSQDVGFKNENKKSYQIDFQFVSNMIIIPLSINGSRPLNFILDSGLRQTILTRVPADCEVAFVLNNKTTIKGLGEEEDLTVWHTKRNTFEAGEIICKNQNLFVLDEDRFNLSLQMGIEINGIIGSTIFENFIVEIDYSRQKIKFHRPETFKYKRRHEKWRSLPLEMYKSKAYIKLPVAINQDTSVVAKLLIDSGASDALWLFPGTNDSIIYKQDGKEMFLGQGLNGAIFGKQSKVKSVEIENYTLKNVNVSIPDTSALYNSFQNDVIGRNGTIGSELLRRFHVIIDYHNQKISLKKNRYFSDPFNYNLSGLEVQKPFLTLPIYEVYQVSEGSPADLAGIKPGDQIVRINHSDATAYTLNEINLLLRRKEGAKIKMKLSRNGETYKTKFVLSKF